MGTTRRVNPETGIIEFVRMAHFGNKEPPPGTSESIIYQIHPAECRRKLIYQIGTADPDRAVCAARMVAPYVAGIDVNAGCPKPFSTSGGMGAALLRTPDKLCAILEALVREIASEFEIGISVKIRILETAAETEALVRRLCATGITGLTVHCRTTPMRPRERAIRGQLRMIANVCREAGVACVMNGDVESRDQAKKLVEEYGVDGAMIATAAEKNSSCFRTKAEGGLVPWQQAVDKYLDLCMETRNRLGNTKFLLGNMIPGKWPGYVKITQSKSYTQVVRILGYDGNVERRARETDAKLGIDPDTGVPKKLKGKKRNSEEVEVQVEADSQENGDNANKKSKVATSANYEETGDLKPFSSANGSNVLPRGRDEREVPQSEKADHILVPPPAVIA